MAFLRNGAVGALLIAVAAGTAGGQTSATPKSLGDIAREVRAKKLAEGSAQPDVAPAPPMPPAPTPDEVIEARRRVVDLTMIGDRAADERRFPEAEQALREAIKVGKAYPEATAELVRAYGTFADVQRQQGRNQEAQATLDEAQTFVEQKTGSNSDEMAFLLDVSAFIEGKMNETEREEAALRRAVAIREILPSESDPYLPGELVELAHLCHASGRDVEATGLLERVIRNDATYRKTQKLDGPEDASLMKPLELLGTLYQRAHRYGDAEHAFLHMLRVAEGAYPANDPALKQPLTDLATLYRAMGRKSDAERMLARLDAMTLPTGK